MNYDINLNIMVFFMLSSVIKVITLNCLGYLFLVRLSQLAYHHLMIYKVNMDVMLLFS